MQDPPRSAKVFAGWLLLSGIMGLVTALAGFSRKTPAQEREPGTQESSQWRLATAAILFLLFLSLALSKLFDTELAKNGCLWTAEAKRLFLQQHFGAAGAFLLV